MFCGDRLYWVDTPSPRNQRTELDSQYADTKQGINTRIAYQDMYPVGLSFDMLSCSLY